MTKRKWLLFISLGVVVGFSSFLIIFLRGTPGSQEKASEKLETEVEVPQPVTKTYTDPAGFSFSYLDNVTLEKKEADDEKVYSSLEITASDLEKPLVILVEDTTFSSLDEWQKEVVPASFSGKAVSLDVGDLKARQLVVSGETITGALDQGVLFTFRLPSSSPGELKKAYGQILTSFAFTPPEPPAEISDTGQEEMIEFEGEEVIE